MVTNIVAGSTAITVTLNLPRGETVTGKLQAPTIGVNTVSVARINHPCLEPCRLAVRILKRKRKNSTR